MLARLRTSIAVGVLCGAATFLAPHLPHAHASAGASYVDALAKFSGDFVFVGGQKQRKGVDDAIEVAVEAIAAGVQDLARKRLGPPNSVPEQIRIDLNDGYTTIALDDRSVRAETNSSKPTTWTNPTGMRVRVWHKLANDHLVEKMVGIGGSRKNVYRLNSDGSRLHVDVTMSSPMLPRSIKYRLTYRRR